MQGRGLNRQVVIVAAIALVVLVVGAIILSGTGVNLFGTAGGEEVAEVPTAVPPTAIPPTEVPPTAVPPTEVPPTAVPPTEVPPTEVPPTEVPPTEVPPTAVPPTEVPPTAVPPTEVPPTAVPPTEVPPTAVPPTAVPPTEVPPTAVPPTEVPPTAVPPTEVPPTEVPTDTPVPPTDTPVPPTDTPVPTDTATTEAQALTEETEETPPTDTTAPTATETTVPTETVGATETPEEETATPTATATSLALALGLGQPGPVLSVDGQCFVPDDDSVTFYVRNNGQAMFEPGTLTTSAGGSQSIYLGAGESFGPIVLSAYGVSSVQVSYRGFSNTPPGQTDSVASGQKECVVPTATPTDTATFTPSYTWTPSITPSETLTPSNTPSNTPTLTPSNTYTPSNTPTDTPTLTPSNTRTPTNTRTPSPTRTPSRTPSNTPTMTPTPTYQECGRPDCASLEVTGRCEAGEVVFVIRNTADEANGDMIAGTQWRLYQDGNLVQTGTTNLIPHGGTQELRFSLSGDLRLEVDQPVGHPGTTVTQASVSGCVPTNTPTYTNSPTNTRTPRPTRTPTNTRTPTLTPSQTYTPSNTATRTPTFTPSNTYTPSSTRTPTSTPTLSPPIVLSISAICEDGQAQFVITNNGGAMPSGSRINWRITGSENPGNFRDGSTGRLGAGQSSEIIYHSGFWGTVTFTITSVSGLSSQNPIDPAPPISASTECVRPTNTPTNTPTITRTPSLTPSTTPTFTPTMTYTPSLTPSTTPTNTPTLTPSYTPTMTSTPRPPNFITAVSCDPVNPADNAVFTLTNVGGDMPNAGELFIDEVGQPLQGPISFQLTAGESQQFTIAPNARVFGSYTSPTGRQQRFDFTAACVPRPTDTPTSTPTNTPTFTPTPTEPTVRALGGECSLLDRVLVFTAPSNGEPLNETVNYTVTGPNGFSANGTFGPLDAGEDFVLNLGSVPPGNYIFTVFFAGGTLQVSTEVTCIEVTLTPTNTSTPVPTDTLTPASTSTPVPTDTVTPTSPPPPSLTGAGQCVEDDLTFTVTNNGSVSSSQVAYTVSGPQGALQGGTIPVLNPGESAPAITYLDVPSGMYTLTTAGPVITVTVECVEVITATPTTPVVTVTVVPPSLTGTGVCVEDELTFTITNDGGSASQPVDYTVFGPQGALPGGTIPALDPGGSQTVNFSSQPDGTYTLFTVDNSVTVIVECAETPPICGEVTEVSTDGVGAGFPSINMEACEDTTVLGEMEPIEVGGAICPDWLVYHTNLTGDWEVFRLGELPDEPDAEANLTQGVGERVYDVSPARSPDSEWIAFASNRDGNWELYVGRTDGTEQRRVTFNTVAVDTAPAWSPNGQYIAFQTTRDGNWNLYMVDVTTGGVLQLTDAASNEVHPFWHPDGAKLVYQSDRDGIWQVYEIDLTTSPYTETLLSDGAGDDHDPAYSFDGEQVAFRSYRDGENSVVYVMDVDGSNVQQISDPAANALNHVFSPDDTLIAYESDLDGDPDIYVFEFETDETRLLTDNTTVDVAPTWLCASPTIVWTSNATEDQNVGADNNIFSVNALPIDAPPINVKTEASQLTFDPETDQYPQNSPALESASRAGQVPGQARNR